MRKSFSSAFLAAALIVLLAIPRPAFAWGNTGHQAVAYVAWKNMKPATRAKIYALLQQVPTRTSPNGQRVIPGYADWVKDLPAGITEEQKEMYIFMRAANWPDTAKRTFLHDTDDPMQDKPEEREANTGFTDTSSHGYWHFVDTPLGTAYRKSSPEVTVPSACERKDKDGNLTPPTPVTEIPAAPSVNAASEIALLRTALASNETDDLKAYDVIWIEHMVGDIHQPLHAIVRFTDGIADEGGNCVMISLAPGLSANFKAGWTDDTRHGYHAAKTFKAPSELHGFWDDLPGAASLQNVQFAETYAKALPAATGDIDNTDPQAWATESFNLAKTNAYKSPIGKGLGAPTRYVITAAYYKTARSTADQQIALAGTRLAHLLDAAFAN